jgi:hypothetical protein
MRFKSQHELVTCGHFQIMAACISEIWALILEEAKNSSRWAEKTPWAWNFVSSLPFYERDNSVSEVADLLPAGQRQLRLHFNIPII